IDAANAKNIVLTLSSAVPNKSAKVNITYAPGTLKGVSGSAVAAFGPVAVDNKVLVGIDILQDGMKVYPNPAINVLNITSDSKIENVGFYSISGQKILEIQNTSGNSVTVPVSELQKGVYLLKVKTENKVTTHRFSKK
ncbi:MAG TPA: T9SS type A sorting domain-containing protein, partial [Prolixibacteraceae bacterium]|nr:T9SS type A sorting domain-containing protein [Prolixibacteraceae bacterium]